MTDGGRRDEIWSGLERPWDLIVVGGGITGAGILREAVRLGLSALLVEKRDFGWGTSSRSSKLVHGGLRYLKEGKLGLTRTAVQERERLLDEGPGLIDPMGFLLATYKGDHPGRWTYSAGLSIYDLLALKWSHRYYSASDFQMLAPHLAAGGLEGGFRYGDAQTDDARLVLRVIREAERAGGVALNYVEAQRLLRGGTHHTAPVVGVRLADQTCDRVIDLTARVIVNATGAWADRLRAQVGGEPVIRPLRGSHLLFPARKFPVAQAVGFLHPVDRRPVFVFPWEGVTLVGTTDVDHDQPLDGEPAIDGKEVAYLMAAVEAQFPALNLGLCDVLSTFAGIRPVIGTGKADPSQESRDHVVWDEHGLLTVTGGKLTTFRRIALDALEIVRHRLPELPKLDESMPVLDPVQVDPGLLPGLDEEARRRLTGRYGHDVPELAAAAGSAELELIPGTFSRWAELRWAARAEQVVHLDDLLLRRVRVGHLLPRGGEEVLPRVRAICQGELAWDDDRWQREESAYLELWRTSYGLPEETTVPSWTEALAEAEGERELQRLRHHRTRGGGRAGAALLLGGAAVAALVWAHRRSGKRRHGAPSVAPGATIRGA